MPGIEHNFGNLLYAAKPRAYVPDVSYIGNLFCAAAATEWLMNELRYYLRSLSPDHPDFVQTEDKIWNGQNVSPKLAKLISLRCDGGCVGEDILLKQIKLLEDVRGVLVHPQPVVTFLVGDGSSERPHYDKLMERLKAECALPVMPGVCLSSFSWASLDRPELATWSFKVVCDLTDFLCNELRFSTVLQISRESKTRIMSTGPV